MCLGFMLPGFTAAKPASPETMGLDMDTLQEKRVEEQFFYFGTYSIEQAKNQNASEAVAKKLAQTIAFKTETEIDGAFSLVVEGENINSIVDGSAALQLGWWVKKIGEPVDNFRSEIKPQFKCLSVKFKGDQLTLINAWQKFYETTLAKNYKITGDGRMLINLHSNTGYMMAELQLAIE